MSDPFRDAEAGARARVTELEAEHQRLATELAMLRTKNPDGITQIELLEIQVNELQFELVQLRESRRPKMTGIEIAARALPAVLIIIIFVAMYLKQK